jgi:uncharacterized protein
MQTLFSEIITTEEQLRAVMGAPNQRVLDKVVTALDDHCRALIAASPFVLISSSDAQGNLDVSPKGDPPGFVQVLDDQTLVIPDRVGNRRADTLRNILQTGKVGLLFLMPGKAETLRVNGSAIIVRDRWLCEPLAVKGKVPDFAMVVTVDEAFIHCAKCVIRSHLWEADQWPDVTPLPSIARILVDHAQLPESVAEIEIAIDESYRERLY